MPIQIERTKEEQKKREGRVLPSLSDLRSEAHRDATLQAPYDEAMQAKFADIRQQSISQSKSVPIRFDPPPRAIASEPDRPLSADIKRHFFYKRKRSQVWDKPWFNRGVDYPE